MLMLADIYKCKRGYKIILISEQEETDLNIKIRTCKLNFSLKSVDPSEYTEKERNSKEFLKEVGFNGFYVYKANSLLINTHTTLFCDSMILGVWEHPSLVFKFRSLKNKYVFENKENGCILIISLEKYLQKARQFLGAETKYLDMAINSEQKYYLFSEFGDVASDNGYEIFKYYVLEKKREDAFFITTQSVIDKEQNDLLRNKMVLVGSEEHKIKLFNQK